MKSLKRVTPYAVLAAILLTPAMATPAQAAGNTKPVSASAFKALKKTVSKISSQVAGISRSIAAMKTSISTIQTSVSTIQTSVSTIKTSISTIQGQIAQGTIAITSLGSTLQSLGTSVQSLGTSVQDTTTGLPGLNTARPLIGTLLATTGECSAAYGTATTGPCVGPGSEFTLVGHVTTTYAIHFVRAGNAVDVSHRVFSVTPLNSAVFTSADSCAIDSTRCGNAVGSADASVDDALIGTSSTLQSVQVAAIAG
jgi:prefoldin subunit 5